MAPKQHRGGSSGQVRTHSRSSSATRLGANLQLTQKDPAPSKHVEKSKKSVHNPDANNKQLLPNHRVTSAHRIHSKEQLHQYVSKKQLAPHPQQKTNGAKAKPGFTLSDRGDDDDEDWVSSESGAATPNHNDSSSDTISEVDTPHPAVQPQHATSDLVTGYEGNTPSPLPRIDTVRPSQMESLAKHNGYPKPEMVNHSAEDLQATQFPQHATHMQEQQGKHQHQSYLHELDGAESKKIDSPDIPAQPQHSVRSTAKRPPNSRPPSTHSLSSRDNPLRPHPLIRGQSHGHSGQISLRPAPLTPLTVIPDSAIPHVSTSPPSSLREFQHHLTTSPVLKVTPISPTDSRAPNDRRTSFSSAKSATTLPSHSTLFRDPQKYHERHRTLSTISSSSSSAALSSLTHLPTVTRPPSPQSISFFPPINPHVNIEAIHPLLPGPYLNNHLTVLVRRTPIRESFDRVIRAKQAR